MGCPPGGDPARQDRQRAQHDNRRDQRRAGKSAAAFFDSVPRFSLPGQGVPSQARLKAWYLTHAAEAWIDAGQPARGETLADSIRSSPTPD